MNIAQNNRLSAKSSPLIHSSPLTRGRAAQLCGTAMSPSESFAPGEVAPKLVLQMPRSESAMESRKASGMRSVAQVAGGMALGAAGLVGLLAGCGGGPTPVGMNAAPQALVKVMDKSGDFEACHHESRFTPGSLIFHEQSTTLKCNPVQPEQALNQLESGQGVNYSGRLGRTFLQDLQDARNYLAMSQDGKGTSFGDDVVDAASRFRNSTYQDVRGKFEFSALRNPFELVRGLAKGGSESFITPGGRKVTVEGVEGLKKADALYGKNASGLTLSEGQKQDLLALENLKFPGQNFAVAQSAMSVWSALESGQTIKLDLASRFVPRVEVSSWDQLHEVLPRILNQGAVEQYRRPDLQQAFDSQMDKIESHIEALTNQAKALGASTQKLPDTLRSEQLVVKDGSPQLGTASTPNQQKADILATLDKLEQKLNAAPVAMAEARARFAQAQQRPEAERTTDQSAGLPLLWETGVSKLPGKPMDSPLRGYDRARWELDQLFREFRYPQAPSSFQAPADTLMGWNPGAM